MNQRKPLIDLVDRVPHSALLVIHELMLKHGLREFTVSKERMDVLAKSEILERMTAQLSDDEKHMTVRLPDAGH